ncbi:PAP2-domain-containing protein [Basidiobolus meristosporus CBS 931.73]|uniref:PAP2-domain-containing protein n=1 Tax=Basidiobolus meristosporus CBS 931.73 TaxID=1314790 RepID=A0A1Y1WQQ5_9FUNG|nr:PAP2-domain-containing protein [Basidiobolus meristosporus CBS 931.73]ORY08388.1 PAP2-domain-containing protein [Basidiobolus meristosporus CBS 931.73]|eukprot:ORX75454.1 PAP2-domain-containing protein [Basidiobolus meristosporus CBS 931.73]
MINLGSLIKAYYRFFDGLAHYLSLIEIPFLCLVTIPFIIWNSIHWSIKLAIFGIGASSYYFIPRSRAIIRPALPVFAWLSLFITCGDIPTELRPGINVTFLPRTEQLLFGGNLSDVLASNTADWKDILAWIVYGVLHFVNGFIAVPMMYFLGPKGTLPKFARAYGYMNLAGVITQLLIPTASPWYLYLYGLEPATYAIHGEPGGLARIDRILNLNLYSNAFSNSPLVFGAFPSLHSGCAVMINLFLGHIKPYLIPFNFLYIVWIWWACLYFRHHYLIDLIGGFVYAFVCFLIVYKGRIAPQWDGPVKGTPELLPTHNDYVALDNASEVFSDLDMEDAPEMVISVDAPTMVHFDEKSQIDLIYTSI